MIQEGTETGMANGDINWITGFIWNIADDVLRDVYVRGKYRDVILPMTVIRRLDAVLEKTKDDVLKINKQLDAAGIANKHAALGQAAGNAFYNISPFPLRDLRARAPFWLAKALENQIQVAKRQPDFDLLEVPQVVGLSNKL
jgi:type I restriction-modification system DNA methylase subunit